jgi:hypothetical protein
MIIERNAGPTLAAVEMDPGDELHIRLADGSMRKVRLRDADAHVVLRGKLPYQDAEGIISYRIRCDLEIDGELVQLARTIPSQENFRDPPSVYGLHIWLDAVDDLFEFLTHNHGRCRPTRKCRLAVWEAGHRICPQLVHPWCPLPIGGLRVQQCYRGEDTWLGPYGGKECHGGLDINHPAGTPIWTPLAIDEQGLFDSVAGGANNNRWRGLHHWPDGTSWILQVHHVGRLRVPENQPLAAGTHLADGASVLCGAHEHSHFVFGVRADGRDVLIDPWLLFRQMYLDRATTTARDAW